MEFQFCLAFLICLVVATVPGWLTLGMLGLKADLIVPCTSAVSICFYVVSGVALDLLGITGWPALLCTALLLSLIAGGILKAILRRAAPIAGQSRNHGRRRLLELCVGIAFSLVVICFIFIWPMDGLDSFVQFDDNVTHLGLVTSMVNGGSFSIFSTTSYPGSLPAAQIPIHSSGFYPNGWHILVALSSALSGATSPVAENAANVALVAVVFPAGCSALLMRLFPDSRGIGVAAGAVCLASAAFPLRMLTVHGPFPNVAAFCLIPSVCTLFISAFPYSKDGPRLRGRYVPAFLLAAIGGAATHPNMVFSSALLLTPYLVCRVIPRIAASSKRARTPHLTTLLQVAVCFLIIVVWVALQRTSVFSSVVNFIWESTREPLDALASVVNAGFFLDIPQYLLALLIALGFGRCVRERQHAWLAVSYALVALVFSLGLALDFETRKLFTGYWYNDPERTSALLAIAAVPLSALGLQWAASLVAHVLGSLLRRPELAPTATGVLAVVLGIPFSQVNYSVEKPLIADVEESAFSFAEGQVAGTYNFTDVNIYTQEERDFVQRARDLIPDGALVLNFPFDGSVFSYASERMNVYYKSCRTSGDTADSELIRTRLNRIASDADVLEAVRNTGAHYVLVLDSGGLLTESDDIYTYLGTCRDGMWDGFLIDEDTPGFSCVLSEGPLALYEITALTY